jgi:acetyl-CoA carboxylase biotin carboxyl carrier protein
MTIEEIRELIRVFNESGLGEMEVQRGENRLRLTRASQQREIVGLSAPSAPAIAAPPIPPAVPVPAAVPVASAEPPAASQTLVRSPIVGTYYDQPSPGAPPFVKVGDAVAPGQVLCIIESMKLMNEIEAEIAGIVTSKLVENGHAVEYGETLFAIQPR